MKIIISLILTITLSFGSLIAVNAEEVLDNQTKQNTLETALSLINVYAVTEDTVNQTMKKALIELASEDEQAFYKVMNAIAKTVDEFSCYYTKEEWEELSNEISGVICGIGVTALVTDGYFEVVTTLEGGSAKEGGIVPGDLIIEADGIDITGNKAEMATNYITGEEGTFVTLKVKKKDGTIETYILERRVVVVPSVETQIIEDGEIGYIIISSFTNETAGEVKKTLEGLKEQNIENIIIDLRYNGGGAMDGGLLTASLFMDKDEIIIATRDKIKDSEPHYYRTGADGFDFNTVILINEYTASASEIMASAVVENGHAVSVGKTTYGKASAQTVFPLVTGGALRITTMHYYTAKNNFINKTGIIPTYEVENTKYRYSWDEAPKLTYVNKYNIGDENVEIEGIEKMLSELGYFEGTPDKVYDEKTKKAVSLFQKHSELYPYGICDITTQSYLLNKYIETDFYNDDQLDYAINLLKNN